MSRAYRLAISILACVACACIWFEQYKYKSQTQTSHNQTADKCITICIINDHNEGSKWFDGPTKSELLKLLAEKPSHLFITPRLWKSFCLYRNRQIKKLKKVHILQPFEQLEIKKHHVYNRQEQKHYNQDNATFYWLATVLAFNKDDWEFYDTHAGLYYMRKKGAPNIGLALNRCTHITNPCNMRIGNRHKQNWITDFMSLFDINAWRKNNLRNKKVVYISGHGTQRSCCYKHEDICGLPAHDFARLISFFNDDLHIDILGVQTCYWPSKRILELLNHYGKGPLTCHLLTPLDKEVPLRAEIDIPAVQSYAPATKKLQLDMYGCCSLLSGLCDIANWYDGALTPQLWNRIHQIEIVHMNEDQNIKTCLVDAHTKQTLYI